MIEPQSFPGEHYCTVCAQPMTRHHAWCDVCEVNHWPPLCCPGCGCLSFEEAHPNLYPTGSDDGPPAPGELGRHYRDVVTAPIVLTEADEEQLAALLGKEPESDEGATP